MLFTALNSALHCRYLTEFVYRLRIKRKGKYLHIRNAIALQIILRNEILEIKTCSKLQVPKTK